MDSSLDHEGLITHLLENSHPKILSEDPSTALAELKQIEELLEALATKGSPTSPKHIVLTLYNTDRLWGTQRDALFTLTLVYSTQNLGKIHQKAGSRLKHLKFVARMKLQHCTALSNVKKHSEALQRANEASEITEDLLKQTVAAHKAVSGKVKTKKFTKGFDTKNLKNTLETAVPTPFIFIKEKSRTRERHHSTADSLYEGL